MTAEQVSDTQTIAGFWRRIIAFIVDDLILGVIGVIAGYFLKDEFVHLGAWGRLLGFSVALIYFGIQNSRLTGGQTFGKQLFNIKVVTRDGKPLSVAKAFLRFLPLGIVWFLNNAQLSESVMLSGWIYILSIAIFGIGLSIIYLYIFNRKTRQSLHDLLVDSYVVSDDAEGSVAATALWRVHLIVVALLIVAAGITPYFTKNLASREPFASLMNVYHAINSQPWIASARVNKGQSLTSTSNGNTKTTYLSITAYSKDSDIENAERAKQLAFLALSADSSARNLDLIQVTLSYGYDIGISSSWQSKEYTHSPEKWLAE